MTSQETRASVGLGAGQLIAWGSSYYLPAILVGPVVADTGWSRAGVVAAFSGALVVAGVCSPWVGTTIQTRGGGRVLSSSAFVMAIGLLLLSTARHYVVFVLGWLVIGLAMALGLYDAAFATVGQRFGANARSVITNVTLLGGFATTVCWPLSAWWLTVGGWRGVCMGYAVLHLVLVLPVYRFALGRRSVGPWRAEGLGGAADDAAELFTSRASGAAASGRTAMVHLTLTAMATAMIGATLSVFLIEILQTRGAGFGLAVGFGALVGPAQVAGRIGERLLGFRYHPAWTLVWSNWLVCVGLVLLWLGYPTLSAGVVIYGMGNGLKSIARGTLPLALFGPAYLPRVLGRVALPYRLTQAAAPVLAAGVVQWWGVEVLLVGLVSISAVAVGPGLVLLSLARNSPRGRS